MRLLLVLLMNVYFLLVAAQQSEEVFTVRNPYNVWLQPPMEQIFSGHTYHFNVKGIAITDITSATMNRARVLVTDTCIVIMPDIVTAEPRIDSLELFIIRNGKQRRVLNHVFKVVKRPSLDLTDTTARNQPIPNVVLLHWHTNRRQMFKNDKATMSEMRGSPDLLRASTPNQQATITSYKMDINCGGAVQKFTANNASITKPMRDALNGLTPGCTIKLYEIECIRGGSSNDENIIGPYSILVTE